MYFFPCVKLLIYSAISVVKNQFNCTFKFFLSFFWINLEPGIRIFKSKNTNQNNLMKKITILCLSVVGLSVQAQTQVMTPETLWKLGRVSPIKVSDNNKMLYYSVTTPNVAENDFRT